MVLSLNSVSGFPSTSTPGMATLGLWLVCHCPVGGHMRHQQLVARNLGMCVEKFFFNLGGEVAYVANGAELGARWAFLHISSTLDRHTVTPTEERRHLVTLGEHGAEAGDWAQASVVAWAKSAGVKSDVLAILPNLETFERPGCRRIPSGPGNSSRARRLRDRRWIWF